MGLRIIAGSVGGRRLTTPVGMEVRPTTGRVRQAVFNSLHSAGLLEGAVVLDLFAGSGALGLEALSRGADSATFIEQSRAALDALEANISATGFGDRCRVVPSDVMDQLPRLSSHYDIALCDPPYSFDAWSELLAKLPAEVVMVESDRTVSLGPEWVVFKQQRYAGTVVVLARRQSQSQQSQCQ